MFRTAPLTLALVLALSPATAAPTPKDVKAKSALDRVKPVGIGGLLDLPTVRQSLKLTDEQEKKITAVRKEVGEAIGAIAKAQQNNAAAAAGQLDGIQEMMDKISDAAAGYDGKVLEVLTGEQTKRLRQLHLQREGPAALVGRYAVRELGLSAEQEDAMGDELAVLQRAKMFDMLGTMAMMPGQPGVDKVVGQRAARVDEVRDKMLKHLTADQRKKWKEMIGEEVATGELLKGTADGFVYKLAMEFAK